MPIEDLLSQAPILVILVTTVVYAWRIRRKQIAGREAWLHAGWTVVRQDMNRLLVRASSVSTRVYRGLAVELVSERPPSSVAPFHETEGVGFFPLRWRTYLRVDLGSRRVCPFQLFERAALVKAPFFSVRSVGAAWFPQWLDRLSIGDPRLDSRFELYAAEPARAISLVAALTAPLLAGPYFGLLEVVGSELRVYVSTRAAGLVGDYGTGFAAHLDALSDLVVDVASALRPGDRSEYAGAMSKTRGREDAAAENHSRVEMLGMSKGRPNWVGWSALGLVVAFGFVVAQALERFSHAPPPAGKLPSAAGTETNPAKSQAPAASSSPATSAPQLRADPPTTTPAHTALAAESAASAAMPVPATHCESVVDGLTLLRPCTGAPGEVRSPLANSKAGKVPQCVVSLEGLSILRDCQSTKGERPALPGAATTQSRRAEADEDSLLIWRPIQFEVLSVSGDVHVRPEALSPSLNGKDCLIVLNKHEVGQLQVRMAMDQSGKLTVTDVPEGQAAPSRLVECLLGLRGKPLAVRGGLPTRPFSVEVQLKLSY